MLSGTRCGSASAYIRGAVSVRYDVLNGEAFGQKSGANRYLYVPDPLGSVVNLLDTSQTTAGTYVYWPYGEVVTHTGATTPMQFLGSLGYQTQIANRTYVRARHYRADLGRWQTDDPIGFLAMDINPARYVANGPTTFRDPSGLIGPCAIPCVACAPCVIDLALVCSDCATDWRCWGECLKGTVENLPWWLRTACETACLACVACFLRALPDDCVGEIGLLATHRRCPWTCKCSCHSVGPTPPCGDTYHATGSGFSKGEAQKVGRKLACAQVDRHGGCCHPKHGVCICRGN